MYITISAITNSNDNYYFVVATKEQHIHHCTTRSGTKKLPNCGTSFPMPRSLSKVDMARTEVRAYL